MRIAALLTLPLVSLFLCAAELPQVQAFPGTPAPHPETVRGWELTYQGKFDEAATALEAGLKADPGEPAAQAGLVRLQFMLGDTEAAMAGLMKLLDNPRRGAWSEMDALALGDWLHVLKDDSAFVEFATRFCTKDDAYPYARLALQRVLAEWLYQRGRFEDAQKHFDATNPARAWALIGPFDNRDNAGIRTASAPEHAVELDKPVMGRNREVRWYRPAGQPYDGFHDFAAAFEPRNHVLVYGATVAYAPVEGWYVLQIGCAGSLRAWVNGRQAAVSDELNLYGSARVREAVYLRKGANAVLVKSGIEEDGPWGFDVRLFQPKAGAQPVRWDSSDAAFAEASAAPAPQIPPMLKLPDLGLLAQLDEVLAAHPRHVPSLEARGGLLTRERRGPLNDPPGVKDLRAALQIMPASPVLKLVLSFFTPDSNEARQAAEAALVNGSGSPEVWARLVGLALAREQHILAAQLAQQGLEKTGIERGTAIREQLAGIYAGGLPQAGGGSEGEAYGKALAAGIYDDLLKRMPNYAGLWQQAISHQLSRAETRATHKQALDRVGGDTVLRSAYAQLLLNTEREKEAAELLEGLARARPFVPNWTLSASDAWIKAGDNARARTVLEDGLKTLPENPALMQALAGVLHRNGETSLAVELFRNVLRIKPNSPEVKDYLELLNVHPEDQQRFYQPYAVELRSLRQPQPAEFADDPGITLFKQEVVRVNTNGSTSRSIHIVGKVLRPQGIRDWNHHEIYYEPERQVVDIQRAVVISPDGRELSRASFRDTSTSAAAGVQTRIYDQHFLKQVTFADIEPGALVELKYTIRDTGLNIYGDYFADTFFLSDINPVVRSEYILDVPEGLPIQTRVFNAALEPETLKTAEAGRKVLKWSQQNAAGMQRETFMPPAVDQFAQLQVTTMRSWQETGQWYWNLARESLQTDDAMAATVRELVKDAKTDTEKLRAIHDWVIGKIRYLGIEFGRNGYKPHRAADSFKALYGDCKDTAVLITAMLKLAGIESKLVLIRTTDAGSVPENSLPMPNLFNHCIAYVPNVDGRPYWIDCTTDYHQLGEVPFGDQLARVLVVDDKGGQFVQIPGSKPEENRISSTFTAELTKEGGAKLTMREQYEGEFAPGLRQLVETPGDVERMAREVAARRFNQAEVVSTKHAPRDARGPMWMETVLNVPLLAARSGERKALPASLDPVGLSQRFARDTKRTNDLYFYRPPWQRKTVTTYRFAAGTQIAGLPDEVKVEEPFARFTRTVKREGLEVVLTEELTFTTSLIPRAGYDAFRAFCNRVDALAEQRVLFSAQ